MSLATPAKFSIDRRQKGLEIETWLFDEKFNRWIIIIQTLRNIILEKVTNIEYGNVDFENDIIEFLTSTPI